MSEPDPSVPVFDLGFYGALRLLVGPKVQLHPNLTDAVSVKTLRMSPLPLKGTCVNLTEPVLCKVEWIVSTELLGGDASELRVKHPRQTVIVPNGGNYEVKERTGDPGHERDSDLVLDAFELGLLGTGRLGYSLELEMMGKPSVTVERKDSRIFLELGIDVEVAVVDAHPESGTPPAGDAPVDAVAPALLAPTRLLANSAAELLQVGAELEFRVRPAEVFEGRTLELSIAEYDPATKEVLDGTATVHRWTGSRGRSEEIRWRVGMVRQSEDHPFVLASCYGAKAGDTRHFGWSVSVFRPGPPPAAPAAGAPAAPAQVSPAVAPDHIHSFPHPFCKATHPGLTSLEIGLVQKPALNLDPDSAAHSQAVEELVLEGKFDGFEPHLWFDVAIELMAKTRATVRGQEVERLCSLSKILGEIGRNDAVVRAKRVELGVFRAALLRWSDCKEALAAKDPDLKVFAVVEFAPGGVGGEDQPVFSSVAGYTANLESARHEDGFAPFKAGMFAPPDSATGVCSKLIDFKGATSSLAGTAAAVPPEQLPDYKWFLAAVAGEAMSCTDGSLRGVAHTIMNRVNSTAPEWKAWTTVELAVKAPSQFESCFGKRADGVLGPNEPFKQALAYFERRYVKKDPQAAEKDPRLAHIETVVMPVFLRLNPRDNGRGVTHFFSPALQAALGRPPPDFASHYPEVTSHFISSGDGSAGTDFRFFAMKLRTGERP